MDHKRRWKWIRTSNADPRPPIKGQKLPPYPQPFVIPLIQPPLRPELRCVLAEQVRPAVHDVRVIPAHLALLDQHGGLSVRPAAQRQDRIRGCLAAVLGQDGVEAQGLVDEGAQVFQILYLVGRGRLVVEGVDFGSETGVDVRALGEREPYIREEGRGGVAACDEDAEQLRADFEFVGRLRGEGVQEDVAGRMG